MASIRTYQHAQNTPSADWLINHKLGVYPIVDVLVDINGVLTKIIPLEIVLVDVNNIRVQFSQPFTGSARLV